ncbi:MAG: nucleoside deaminase [Ignavibacteriae bacterium]|nr:nucleoside deaminase [Ignavibacteriota bacterium]
MNFHQQMMAIALEEAAIAVSKGEVPIGAVITIGDEIIARAHNLTETNKSPLAHAELLAIEKAASVLNEIRLAGCTLYVTLEPCLMCTGGIVLARIEQVFFGCRDPKAGACRTLYEAADDNRLNHQSIVREGIMEEECSAILQNFFQDLRKKKKSK